MLTLLRGLLDLLCLLESSCKTEDTQLSFLQVLFCDTVIYRIQCAIVGYQTSVEAGLVPLLQGLLGLCGLVTVKF